MRRQTGWGNRLGRGFNEPRRRRAGWVWLGVLLLSLCGRGVGQRFQARLFDQNDGLGSLAINTLVQAPDGHLWVGTDNGLFRYDGSMFEEFGRAEGLRDPSVYALQIDHAGMLWVGTHHGLFRVEDGILREVTFSGRSMRVSVNSGMTAASTGELVVQTPDAMVSVERGTTGGRAWDAMRFEARHPGFPLPKDTDGVLMDRADRLWFGCAGSICRYDGRETRRYGVTEGVAKDVYASLYQARNGRMWFRGRKRILTMMPEDARAEDVSGTLPKGAVVTIFRRFGEDAAGRILAATANGFATWDGGRWRETLATSRGPINGASHVMGDAEGAVWIGTPGQGLLESLGYGRWQNYATAEGLPTPSVDAVAVDRRGTIWLANHVGTVTLGRDGVVRPTALRKEQDASIVVSFAATEDGGMWAATVFGKLFHVNASGAVDFRTGMDAYMSRIRVDGAGNLWVASSVGVLVLRRDAKDGEAPRVVNSPLLAGERVGDFVFDGHGGTWLGSDRGLDHIRGDGLGGGAVEHVPLDGKNPSVRTMALDADGTLWLAGLMPGVMHVRVAGGVGTVLETHTRPELASDMVQFVEQDARGRVWIGTDHGVNVLSGGKMQGLTVEDGLVWNVCNERSFLALADGSVWIGTDGGASHLVDPEALLRRGGFATVVETASYDERRLGAGTKRPWTGGPVAVHFSGLTFRNNQTLVYRYRLAGLGQEVVTTSTPMVRFEGLPPGSYRLEVVAEDPGHGVSGSMARLDFTLTPPWWRTRVFSGMVGLGVLGMVALLWRWRHLALLARQARLEAMVEERTEQIQRMALRDDLTGLPNRKAAMAALRAEYFGPREEGDVCVAIVDLDHFKRINDTAGHLAGDEVLRQAAQRLSAAVRSSDVVGRYGGEEFLVIFRGARHTFGLERCEMLRWALSERPILFEGKEFHVTCSIGFAHTQKEVDPISQLLANADRALYSAKENGRNRVEYAAEDGTVAALEPMTV